ncbi:hypothetical protein V1277_000519 [Bradyrhizobium sp. AZCC 1588]|uniref:hypothetical protein n=1 Tax=unclassified Bradyrhizobium TaxID=2631580 RepID=UPI002FF09688
MTPHIPEKISSGLIDWNPSLIAGNTMPPRDPPDEDDEDEEEEDEEEGADEAPVIREPDED